MTLKTEEARCCRPIKNRLQAEIAAKDDTIKELAGALEVQRSELRVLAAMLKSGNPDNEVLLARMDYLTGCIEDALSRLNLGKDNG